MRWFRKRETRSTISLEDIILQTKLNKDVITREMALNIPTVDACIELISNTVATLPIKLFEEVDNRIEEIKNDERTKLLNDDTRDTLDGFQFKKALVQDYLLMGNAYAYINKDNRMRVKSIHYVRENNVSVTTNADPIFKDHDIHVNGLKYKLYEFIKIARNTMDGVTGEGIIERNNMILAVAYNSLDYENILAKTGGNKKGFIKSAAKLGEEAIKLLKEQWRKMYSKNSENCIVLNSGLEFQESSATATEMQMNENKKANAVEICKIFNVPPSILQGDGKANEADYEKFVKMAILPILEAIISALNKDLLLEKEKDSYYFNFDTKELLKGDIEKRFKAYEIGVKNGFLSINDVRYQEDKEPIEAFNNVIKLGLGDVLYNTSTKEVYTPNTNKSTNIDDLKGGENLNED